MIWFTRGKDGISSLVANNFSHLLESHVFHEDKNGWNLVGEHIGVGCRSQPLARHWNDINSIGQLVEETRMTYCHFEKSPPNKKVMSWKMFSGNSNLNFKCIHKSRSCRITIPFWRNEKKKSLPRKADNTPMFIDADETCHQHVPKRIRYHTLFTIPFGWGIILFLFFTFFFIYFFFCRREGESFLERERKKKKSWW